MASAKGILVRPIHSGDAHAFIRKHHYSGKSVHNSQVHFGIFLDSQWLGVMQFGPSMDKRKLIGLVGNTRWNGFLELNRMALLDDTPRNTESRALSVAMRLIRKHYPWVEWIVSFADATQCGDGTIYRAAGFVLTGIKPNNQIWVGQGGAGKDRTPLTDPSSHVVQRRAIHLSRFTVTKGGNILTTGAASMRSYEEAGFRPLPGYQLRYIYFLNPEARTRLTVPIIPFERIKAMGASMYKGKRVKDSSEPSANHAEEGGAAPTHTLHLFPMTERLKAVP